MLGGFTFRLDKDVGEPPLTGTLVGLWFQMLDGETTVYPFDSCYGPLPPTDPIADSSSHEPSFALPLLSLTFIGSFLLIWRRRSRSDQKAVH